MTDKLVLAKERTKIRLCGLDQLALLFVGHRRRRATGLSGFSPGGELRRQFDLSRLQGGTAFETLVTPEAAPQQTSDSFRAPSAPAIR